MHTNLWGLGKKPQMINKHNKSIDDNEKKIKC